MIMINPLYFPVVDNWGNVLWYRQYAARLCQHNYSLFLKHFITLFMSTLYQFSSTALPWPTILFHIFPYMSSRMQFTRVHSLTLKCQLVYTCFLEISGFIAMIQGELLAQIVSPGGSCTELLALWVLPTGLLALWVLPLAKTMREWSK